MLHTTENIYVGGSMNYTKALAYIVLILDFLKNSDVLMPNVQMSKLKLQQPICWGWTEFCPVSLGVDLKFTTWSTNFAQINLVLIFSVHIPFVLKTGTLTCCLLIVLTSD